ncbi:hypothetical protein [Deinococcus soli (ex Cha et al. 2016)]|uniref:TPR repeat protein n=2 Tax=Deinococcus soli (ex Cha et al. 2016) TaxID=1309411 RepID=A0ACC6KGF8_9DEIO|nr:hypothetical protein [Deinococcus soli (ex Cha et al. 2016)]MDR6218496.1 TPR repeat protein [Deinococcus soli (ex Cha et al. 2016)]MDR6329236.1 TPR repeat protein [Deinococcus soli (ex Cha et al. 2016)]MDR6751509.1 TPR repeat protein [Deinococcus soli (ex Cha et al. 2016)]
MTARLMALLLLPWLAGSAAAASGATSFWMGNPGTLQQLTRAAHAGDAASAIELAQILHSGVGVARQDAEALRLLRGAQKRRPGPAGYWLGVIVGDPSCACYSLAARDRYWRAAALLGDSRAEAKLAEAAAYARTPELAARGLNRLASAARRGNPTAEAAIGAMYLKGTVLPLNPAKGLSWLSSAARKGNAAAATQLGGAYMTGLGELRQNETYAAQLYRRAARQGNAEAWWALSWLYWKQGQRGPAQHGFCLLAQGGQDGAGTLCGAALLAVHGERGSLAGEAWLQRAARQGDPRAAGTLAQVLSARPDTRPEAFAWLWRSGQPLNAVTTALSFSPAQIQEAAAQLRITPPWPAAAKR